MKKLVILAIALFTGATAFADLKSTFKKLDANRKGPFALNMLQGSQSRRMVLDGSPAGTFQFQAAYRNEIGRELVENHGFYTANLFTTNYYELQGEFVYGDVYSSHPLDHAALDAQAALAFPTAASMVRHWVLEKYYVQAFPSSGITRGFRLRGISDSEMERTYAIHFFNFYLNAMTEDFHFLAAMLLAKGSPINDSASLERARIQIAAAYDRAKQSYGAQDPGVKRLYQLRNAIHNQLSEAIIGQIDTFFRDYPSYRGNNAIVEAQNILRAYYNVTAKRLVELAQKAGNRSIQDISEQIVRNGAGADNYLRLSRAIADLRTQISQQGHMTGSAKTSSLLLILSASQFLNKELTAIKKPSMKETVEIALNLIYAEGFLIKDNWEYFRSDVQAAGNGPAAAALLPDIIGISTDTLTQAMNPALDQWISVEPKMASFIDNAAKSSALNTAALIADRMKR